MNDDERELARDPAKLLPFVCELRPRDPNVEELPKRYLVIGQEPFSDAKAEREQ